MLISVTSILSEKDFGTIFAGVIADESNAQRGLPIRVNALDTVMLGRPAKGEVWDVEGQLQDTPAWGWQIKATRAFRPKPTGKLIRAFLAGHCPGIGPERADALWFAFGDDLGTLLSDES